MIILAGLIGGLLVTRGLSDWFSFLEGQQAHSSPSYFAGVAIAYQGGF